VLIVVISTSVYAQEDEIDAIANDACECVYKIDTSTERTNSVSSGAQFGQWIGIRIGFVERWFDLAFAHMNIGDTIINTILNFVIFVVMGILASLILRTNIKHLLD
jgi:hypothetical protein